MNEEKRKKIAATTGIVHSQNSYPYKLINYLGKIDYVQVNRLCMWTHIKTVLKRTD